jgi:hypothetical protein
VTAATWDKIIIDKFHVPNHFKQQHSITSIGNSGGGHGVTALPPNI